jgi:hypothetical protein
MPAVTDEIAGAETMAQKTPDMAPITTTLYDLIAALNEEVEVWEDNMVTATVAHLCHTGNLHFLRLPLDCEIVCG